MAAEWEKLREKVVSLKAEIARFKVDFLYREDFKAFCDNFDAETQGYENICITGYFSETFRGTLQKMIGRQAK